MVQVPYVHKKVEQTGNYSLVVRNEGLFKKKQIIILRVEYMIGVWHPLWVGDMNKLHHSYCKWFDADVYDKLPFDLIKG